MDEKLLPYGNISTTEHLGSIIRQKRKQGNLTQSKLAALSFVGTRFISDLENGKPTLEIGKVLQVTQTLGLELQIQPATSQPTTVKAPSEKKPNYRLLTPHILEQLIQRQETEIPVFKKDNTLFLALAGSNYSHVLKTAPKRFKSAVTNEIFCRQLAKTLELPSPTISILPEYQNTFLIEHQEDNKDISPAEKQKAFLEQTIFNYLIGNSHAEPQKHLLCTTIYPDFSPLLPLKIGGESRYDFVSRDHWIQFAESLRIKPRFVFATLTQLAENILIAMEDVFVTIEKDFVVDIDVIHKICHVIENRVAHVSAYHRNQHSVGNLA